MSFAVINILAGVFCLVLIFAHLISHLVKKFTSRFTVLSHISGGIVFAFLFIHILPEFSEHGEHFSEAMHHLAGVDFSTEILIYFIAMIGFLFFMGVASLYAAAQSRGPGFRKAAFFVQKSNYLILNGLIAYTMPVRVAYGIPFAVLFIIAISIHLLMIDNEIREHDERLARYFVYLLFPLIIIIAAVVAYFTEPEDLLLVAILSAFISGGIIHDIFSKESKPYMRRLSSYLYFLVGGIIGAIILVILQILAVL